MRFWDSSAIVPLVVPEIRSGDVERLVSDDDAMTVWWGTRVECRSALRRRAREGSVQGTRLQRAVATSESVTSKALEITASRQLSDLACGLVDRHALRAADALQLAAAIEARDEQTPRLDFVSLDARLRAAAEREGFAVLPV